MPYNSRAFLFVAWQDQLIITVSYLFFFPLPSVCFKRYDLLAFMFRVCERKVTRSIKAATIISLSNSSVHLEKSRLVAIMTLVLS